MRIQIPILLFLICVLSCTSLIKNVAGQDSIKEDSYKILKSQMNDSLFQAMEGRYVKRSNRVIKSKKEAIELAKTAFWKEYGKDNMINERKYTSHLMNGFWIVRGLLPRPYTGGTIVAILDAENGEHFSSLVWK